MARDPYINIINTIYGAEGGELQLAFLVAYTITNNEKPSFKNTQLLTNMNEEAKRNYLLNHFSNVHDIAKVVLTITSSDDKEILYPYLRQYIKLTQKQFSIWSCLPHKDAPFSHPDMFGDNDFSLSIIDPFKGKQPFLLNNDAMSQNYMDIAYLPQIILDSQILQYVNWYVNDKSKLQGNNLYHVRSMLRYFVSHNYLYSPYFYYFEAISKGSKRQHLKIPFSLSVRMQCLNHDAMLKDGSFVFDDQKFSNLLTGQYSGDINIPGT